jgi:hypothetical protein
MNTIPCNDDTLQPIPQFLEDTLKTMTFYRVAGEWDLAVTTQQIYEVWLLEQLYHFQQAFTWAKIGSMELDRAGNIQRWSSDTLDVPLSAWLEDQRQTLVLSSGFEANLSLCLYWVDSNHQVGRSLIPDSARLIFSQQDRLMTLTIWSNLFTDNIEVYRQTPFGYLGSSTPFSAASKMNRAYLRNALFEWERLAESPIVSWDSQLVKGVERYGFLNEAVTL